MDDVQALQRVMEARFEAVLARLDDDRELATQRHEENRLRLQGIDVEVRRTNGRVTRTEEQIRSLFARLKKPVDGITLANLKWYLACAGGGFAACMFLMKLMGKL